MFLLIEIVDNYQFIKGVFDTELKAQATIRDLDKDRLWGGNYEIHDIKMNEVVDIG